uniref:CBM21 domain-containing protein n=1 Tax=Acrobeloides nanus TaxID=290746 RepID=A0A914C1J1_9BILA
MYANTVKETCKNIIGVINNFPTTKKDDEIIEEKLEYTNFFRRDPKNLILEGEHITIPRGHTGLMVEVHFGVIIKDDVENIYKEKALDYIEGYVVALNNRICDTKYDFDGEDVAETIEFHSDVAISEIVHKGFIENPNDLSMQSRSDYSTKFDILPINDNPSCSSKEKEKLIPKKKKAISFADECGQDLVTVYNIPRHSDSNSSFGDWIDNLSISNLIRDEPSYKNVKIDEKYVKKFKASQTTSEWRLDFPQPVSNYANFRQKLDENNVALENVLLKPNPERIFGTVKVKNIGCDKNVFIRISYDKWKTYNDIQAVYKYSNCNLYKNFEFETEIPKSATHDNPIEFSVCLQVNGQEYWDSNEEQNYVVI